MRGLLTANALDRPTLDRLLGRAKRFQAGERRSFAGTVVGLLFYSDSLRTRVGFQTAAARLRADTFVVTHPRHTPVMLSDVGAVVPRREGSVLAA
jgi:aspartate carbamoyltransferase catalytic subunit